MLDLNILYSDNHILAVNKPPGILVQGDMTGDLSLFEEAKRYIKVKYHKSGNVYLALLHRIDRPVSGVVLFSRTSKSAARLSKQLREKKILKNYHAIIHGHIEKNGFFKDYMIRKKVNSYIVQSGNNAKVAELSFKRKASDGKQSLVEILLRTGRHHQIRVQFAHRGHPVVGDFRYGSNRKFPLRSLALHAHSIEFEHPTLKNALTLKLNVLKTGTTI
ncbi:MAG: RNA pseudouridine synthase [candidate division KSB1 bacterium]|nr:RNA pseudouridine synthase [candidate division KSB1 bacterium]